MSTATLETLDINQIKEILPHRYPFLLVDRVTSLTPGKSAQGYKNVTANEEFFNGHFPVKPIMPGVLIVEALAQLGCITILALPANKGALVLFTGIDSCKFRQMVVPGDKLEMEVELLKIRGPVGKARAVARVDGKLVTEGEVSFAVYRPEAGAKQAGGEE
jgi:3-hydroxyacyl-[acyl-carrier-protein] dehydratase